jgi:hypothetical protein
MRSLGISLFSLCVIAFLNSCSNLSMQPSKTSVKASNTVSNIDKVNDEKDQTKNSMTVTVQQDFKWN